MKGSTKNLAVAWGLLASVCAGPPPKDEPADRPPLIREAAAMPAEEMRLVWSVGTGDGLEFGTIADAVMGDDGTVYVLDDMARRVFVLDQAGRLVRSIGRQGRGPGEFDRPVAISLNGDTLHVVDAGLRRVTAFGHSGEVLDLRRFSLDQSFGQEADVRLVGAELWQLSYYKYQQSLLDGVRGRGGLVRGLTTVQRWDAASGRWHDVLDVPGLEVFVDMDEGVIRDVPNARRSLWAVDPGGAGGVGVWYADTGLEYVAYHAADRGPVFRTATPFRPRRPTRQAMDSFRSALDVPDQDDLRRAAAAARRDLSLPDHLPTMRRILAGSDGSLWILGDPPPAHGDGVVWLRFRNTGEALPGVVLPREVTPLSVQATRLVARRRGAYDIAILELYEGR